MWQRQRFWPLPLLSAILSAHLPSPAGGDRTVRLATQPSSSQALAFLWDHRVQGRLLLPGTAMFELAAAAAAALAGDGSLPVATHPTLAAVSILSPKVLSALAASSKADSSEQAAADVLLCEADSATGQVRVASAPQGSGSAAAPVHLRAAIVLATAAAMTSAGDSMQATANTASQLQQAVARLRTQDDGSRRSAGHTVAQPQLPAATAVGHAESFVMHPAMADVTLHLGAVHVTAGSSKVSRVPVGVAAYSCGASKMANTR